MRGVRRLGELSNLDLGDEDDVASSQYIGILPKALEIGVFRVIPDGCPRQTGVFSDAENAISLLYGVVRQPEVSRMNFNNFRLPEEGTLLIALVADFVDRFDKPAEDCRHVIPIVVVILKSGEFF